MFYEHTQTRHTRSHSSGRVVSPSQRPLPDKQQSQDRDIHAPQRNSNPQSQQARCRRPAPYTKRELRSAITRVGKNIFFLIRSSPGNSVRRLVRIGGYWHFNIRHVAKCQFHHDVTKNIPCNIEVILHNNISLLSRIYFYLFLRVSNDWKSI